MDTQAGPRALIAEDEPVLAADLATRLGRLWPELNLVAVVHHGPAALEAIARLSPDFVFLDIRMPGMTGLEVAQRSRIPHLVFVTAYDQYAVNAFESAAADYLLKPVGDERLARTVERLRARWTSRTPPGNLEGLLRQLLEREPGHLAWIRASVGQETHLIEVGTVVYFRTEDKYTAVQTVQREYLIRTSLKELAAQLDPSQFWQVHRSTIVNIRSVASAQRGITGQIALQLKGRPERITVSRAYAHLFRQM
jgi:DNA-binding LytR/AlgR family response regulator